MGTDSTTQAIRAAFDTWGAAWNRGDLDGYLAGYWDSDQTRYISSGTVIQGKAAIVAAFQARQAQSLGTLEMMRLDIDLLGERDALAFGLWRLVRGETSVEGAFTVHLRRLDGQWLMVSDHTSTKP